MTFKEEWAKEIKRGTIQGEGGSWSLLGGGGNRQEVTRRRGGESSGETISA